MLKKIFTLLLTMLFSVFMLSSRATTAQCSNDVPTYPEGIVPMLFEGNTSPDASCSFYYKIEIKSEAPRDGWYDIPGGKVYLEFKMTDCGWVVSWKAGPGVVIDKVYTKGGPDYNKYDYTGINPRPVADGNLHAPLTPSANDNPKFAGFSHIDFCYRVALLIEKTAETSYNLRYSWEIDKKPNAEYDLFKGDEVKHDYVVKVTKGKGIPEDIMVWGTITIYNPAKATAVIESITDVIPGYNNVELTCNVTFPYHLAAGETLKCTYKAKLDNLKSLVNTVTVVTSGKVDGGKATADIKFGEPDKVFDNEITVIDSYKGELGKTNKSTSWEYSRTLSCFDADNEFIEKETYHNTATIKETGQKASAYVKVTCWELEVAKDAKTSFDRTYTWEIEKEHDAGDDCLILSEGQLYEVNYTVTVTAVYEDDNWAVKGKITVKNPAPIDAVINSLKDVIVPGGIDADVKCNVEFPYTLKAKESFTCSYSAILPDAKTRENKATAVLQNFFYYYDAGLGKMAAKKIGTTGFTGTAVVDFANAVMTETDECVDVYDKHGKLMEVKLGTVCYPYDKGKNVFTFMHEVGGLLAGKYECDEENFVPNTARFITNDTKTEGKAYAEVCFVIPCPGCTLTPGYWKTHSKYGPAPYDATWALLGEDKMFFLSGATYYKVLWTPPAGGNAYYILAHAYIAAELNALNGASFDAAQDAFDKATKLFEKYTPADVAASKGKNASLRNQFIALAEILDKYNNGIIGPGHCNDNSYVPSVKSASSDLMPGMDMVSDGAVKVYPNPFSSEVHFEFTLEKDSHVLLEIFNMTGQKVTVLMDNLVSKGVSNRISFVPADQTPGMFIYRLKMDDEVHTGRILYRKD